MFLYERLSNSPRSFKLCSGLNLAADMSDSAHGCYMKVCETYADLSTFVVGYGLAGDMSGQPVAVI